MMKINIFCSYLIIYFAANVGITFAQSSESINFGLLAYYPFNGSYVNQVNPSESAISGKNVSFIEDNKFGRVARLIGNGFFFREGQPEYAYLSKTNASGFLEIPAPDLTDRSTYSASLWVNQESMSNEAGETYLTAGYSKNSRSLFGDYYLTQQTQSTISTDNDIAKNSPTQTGLVVNQNSITENWNNYIIVQQSKNYKVYMNGVELYSSTTLENPTGNWSIGRHWWDSVANLRIYNRALSSNEVISLYNYEKSPQAVIVNQVSISTKGMLQASPTTRSGVTTAAPPQPVTITTPQILSWLALDENKIGKYSQTSFPAGSKLVAVVSATDNTVTAFQVVDNKNKLLVDVSDIVSFSMDGKYNADISTGKVSASTGLSSPSSTYLYISTLTFDDTAIAGGQNIKFYLSGIASNKIVNSIPTSGSGSYKEIQTFKMNVASGDGSYRGVPMLISGSVTASGTATFSLK
jgi:hypothetical protein